MPEQVNIEKIYQEIIAMKEVSIYILSKEIDRLNAELNKFRESNNEKKDTAIK